MLKSNYIGLYMMLRI